MCVCSSGVRELEDRPGVRLSVLQHMEREAASPEEAGRPVAAALCPSVPSPPRSHVTRA